MNASYDRGVTLIALLVSYSNINLLLSSFGSGGDSDGGDDDDGSYDGLTVDCMDENVGGGHAHGHDDKAVAPFVDFLERYSFVDSSIFSLSSLDSAYYVYKSIATLDLNKLGYQPY